MASGHTLACAHRRLRVPGEASQLDERRYAALGEQPPSDVQDNRVSGSEQALEHEGALQESVERMLGGKADAGKHLLTVSRDDLQAASRDGLRYGRGVGVRLIASGAQGRVDGF